MKQWILLSLLFLMIACAHKNRFKVSSVCEVPIHDLVYKEKAIAKITMRYMGKTNSLDHQLTKLNEALSANESQAFLNALYKIFKSDWSDITYNLATEFLQLDIPMINRIILTESFRHSYPFKNSLISWYCFFGQPYMNPNKSGGIEHLVSAITKGGAEGGWAAIYLFQFIGPESLKYLGKLENDENVFARFSYAQILTRLNKYELAQNILEGIINQECESLNQPIPESINYVYAPWSVEQISIFNNELALELYKELCPLYNSAIKFLKPKADSSSEFKNRLFSLSHALYELDSLEISDCECQ